MAGQEKKQPVRGLEGVIAAETRIGLVDGTNGKLYYAGYDIDDLAEKATYEEVVFLLWNLRLPVESELETLRKDLASRMELPAPMLEWFKRVPENTHPMVVLRSAVSDLAMYDPVDKSDNYDANKDKAASLVAGVPAIVAAYYRAVQGDKPLKPDPDQGVPENFLRMFLGREINEIEARAMRDGPRTCWSSSRTTG